MSTLGPANIYRLHSRFNEMGYTPLIAPNDSDFTKFFSKLGIDINKYRPDGFSKAKALKKFLDEAPNNLCIKFIDAVEKILYESCSDSYEARIVTDLLADVRADLSLPDAILEQDHLSTIEATDDELLCEVKKLLSDGKFTLSIDRLHTFLIRFLKNKIIAADASRIGEERIDKGLNWLLNNVRELYSFSEVGNIISDQYKKILEKFHQLRNNGSYAHDNEILSMDDAKLICEAITSLITYINTLQIKEINLP